MHSHAEFRRIIAAVVRGCRTFCRNSEQTSARRENCGADGQNGKMENAIRTDDFVRLIAQITIAYVAAVNYNLLFILIIPMVGDINQNTPMSIDQQNHDDDAAVALPASSETAKNGKEA